METARPRLEHRQYRDTDNPTPPEFPETGESVDSSSTVSTSQTLPPFLWKEHAVPGTEVKYLRTTGEVDEALQSVKGPFGFDIEWRPSFARGMREAPIALLQLARPDQIFLIQLSGMRKFPKILQNILEDYKIIKAGVGISGDAKKLWRDCGVSLLGAVELSKLARVSDPSRWGDAKSSELIGLARLVEAYRSRRMLKSLKFLRFTITLILHLDAASDALAGALVYQHLLDLNPSVLPHDYTFNFLAGRPELYSYGPVSLLARRASYPKQIPGQEGSSQLNASTTSLGLKLLGISLAGLAIHTWLLETYALDAQPNPTETEKLDPATSISFPTILQLDGEPKMTLLGLGVRRVSFLGINVYSVGFYADLSKVDAKVGIAAYFALWYFSK
ncbi:3'-5' exonuclease [Rhizoctonia solani]|uniref:3'-5' exonuclease n=1 Tax=Rhizoctonia solani TaxID=456999 RepID=A0A8H7HBF1_9AGAM|nr:3'-5' exonuclease [Rhizoctonia solani]